MKSSFRPRVENEHTNWLKSFRRYALARVTIEDCLDKIPNRFMLIHMAAKRVRQIREGAEFLVKSSDNEDIVTALREIAAGKVYVNLTDETSDE